MSPEQGLTPLGFGATRSEIIDFLGEPERTSSILPIETLHYDSMGLEMDMLEGGGIVGLTSISCLSQLRNGPSVRDFAGSTGLGIRIGDSLEQLLEIYGEPDILQPGIAAYIQRGIRFYIQNDAIAGIDISEPLAEELEFEVHNDGSWSIRVREDG